MGRSRIIPQKQKYSSHKTFIRQVPLNKLECIMHATITDWETEVTATPESFAEAVEDYFVDLAYWLFYPRVIHSIYHIFFINW